MPQVTKQRRKEMKQGDSPKVPGDICYYHTLGIIAAFRTEPRWTTIDALFEKYVMEVPTKPAEFGHISAKRWEAAAKLAYFEFYRRIGSLYEDKKAKENGDVYAELIREVFPEKTVGEVKKK